ncbi:MAG: hypothetical protein D3910_22090 [Candidatus Electrothrix sp. ATG2]|nr:hypothetical protein [Candidatus Electrothrix sp. ATG2]
MTRLLFIVTEDRWFVTHRLHLAKAAIANKYRVAVLCRITKYRDVIQDSGVEVIEWVLDRGSINPFTELLAVKRIYHALQHFKPDLVHAVAIKPVLYSAVSCCLAGTQARTFALGGLGFVFSSKRLKARLLRLILVPSLRWALSGRRSCLILQNPDDCSTLVSLKIINSDRVHIIRGAGVDTESDILPRK